MNTFLFDPSCVAPEELPNQLLDVYKSMPEYDKEFACDCHTAIYFARIDKDTEGLRKLGEGIEEAINDLCPDGTSFVCDNEVFFAGFVAKDIKSTPTRKELDRLVERHKVCVDDYPTERDRQTYRLYRLDSNGDMVWDTGDTRMTCREALCFLKGLDIPRKGRSINKKDLEEDINVLVDNISLLEDCRKDLEDRLDSIRFDINALTHKLGNLVGEV